VSGVFAPLSSTKLNYVALRAVPEATMMTLEFIAALYVGAAIGYAIAALLVMASKD
jgi:F0F1-type ATP synthase assembly protein I